MINGYSSDLECMEYTMHASELILVTHGCGVLHLIQTFILTCQCTVYTG
jgi:hypothetical protein